jgi:hypothetical protein
MAPFLESRRRIGLKTNAICAGLLFVCLTAGITVTPPGTAETRVAFSPDGNDHPVLINTCLITNDVKRLAAFYQRILEVEPRADGDTYVEFRTGAGVLAIFASQAQEKYIPGGTGGREQERHPGVSSGRCGSGIYEAARVCEDLGETSDDAALGYPLHLLP